MYLGEQFCLSLYPTIPGQKVLFIRVEYAPWSSHCVLEIPSFLTTNIDGVAASVLAIFAASGLQLGSALLKWYLTKAGLFKRAESFHALATAAIFYFKSPAGISKFWVGEGLLKMLSVSGDALVYTTLPSLSYHPVGWSQPASTSISVLVCGFTAVN